MVQGYGDFPSELAGERLCFSWHQEHKKYSLGCTVVYTLPMYLHKVSKHFLDRCSMTAAVTIYLYKFYADFIKQTCKCLFS